MSAAVVEFLSQGVQPALPSDGHSTEELLELLAASTAILVVDLEMSGPNPAQHEVLEVGGVRATLAEGFPEEASWGERVRPRHIGNAIPGALKVVGYSPKAWRTAIELDDATKRLAELGRGAVLTGWGISNDLRFLIEVVRRSNLDWPFAPVAIDIQPIARKLLRRGDDVDHFNLGHVADRLGIGRMGEHSALADAYATYDVLQALTVRAAEAAASSA
jgi:DNA polymerase III epsilon subunit-like protein